MTLLRVLKTAGAVFLLDFATKAIAVVSLEPFRPIRVVPGFFNLSLVFNRGAAFGLFPGASAVFIVLAAGSILAILIFSVLQRQMPALVAVSLGLICGGAAGNLWDRLRLGYVIDFLDFYVGNWHWPAFNIADASLCTGAGLLFLSTLRHRPSSQA